MSNLEKLAGNKWNEYYDNYNKEKGYTYWVEVEYLTPDMEIAVPEINEYYSSSFSNSLTKSGMSESLKIVTSDCSLSFLSFDNIAAFNLSANAKKSISFKWYGSNDLAFGINFPYVEKVINLTTLCNFVLNSSNSLKVSLVFFNISNLCLSSSLSANSGAYKSCSDSNNFLIKDPFQKNENNLLVSITNLIYTIPIDLSSFNLSSLANSPNLSASSSMNSLLSSLVSRNSSNDNLCKYLVIVFRSNKDQSISGWDSASSLRFSGISIINSAMLTRNREKYIKFSDDKNYDDDNKGTIKINGKIKSLSDYASEKIYQGGKLIKCQI